MTFTLWVAAIGALLAVPASALAQPSRYAPDPADPRAPVAPVQYASAFTGVSPPAPEPGAATPDKLWRTANDTVAGLTGHAGHAGHAGHPAPAPAPAPKPLAAPAAGHGKHHH